MTTLASVELFCVTHNGFSNDLTFKSLSWKNPVVDRELASSYVIVLLCNLSSERRPISPIVVQLWSLKTTPSLFWPDTSSATRIKATKMAKAAIPPLLLPPQPAIRHCPQLIFYRRLPPEAAGPSSGCLASREFGSLNLLLLQTPRLGPSSTWIPLFNPFAIWAFGNPDHMRRVMDFQILNSRESLHWGLHWLLVRDGEFQCMVD